VLHVRRLNPAFFFSLSPSRLTILLLQAPAMLLVFATLLCLALAQTSCTSATGTIVVPGTTQAVELCSIASNCPAASLCTAVGRSKGSSDFSFRLPFFFFPRRSCSLSSFSMTLDSPVLTSDHVHVLGRRAHHFYVRGSQRE
jgi:hypothetical protein